MQVLKIKMYSSFFFFTFVPPSANIPFYIKSLQVEYPGSALVLQVEPLNRDWKGYKRSSLWCLAYKIASILF